MTNPRVTQVPISGVTQVDVIQLNIFVGYYCLDIDFHSLCALIYEYV